MPNLTGIVITKKVALMTWCDPLFCRDPLFFKQDEEAKSFVVTITKRLVAQLYLDTIKPAQVA